MPPCFHDDEPPTVFSRGTASASESSSQWRLGPSLSPLLQLRSPLLLRFFFFLPLLSLCVLGGSGTSSPLAAVLFNQTPFACESGPRPAFVPRLNSPRQQAGTREIFRRTVLSMCKYWPGVGVVGRGGRRGAARLCVAKLCFFFSFCGIIMYLSKKKPHS